MRVYNIKTSAEKRNMSRSEQTERSLLRSLRGPVGNNVSAYSLEDSKGIISDAELDAREIAATPPEESSFVWDLVDTDELHTDVVITHILRKTGNSPFLKNKNAIEYFREECFISDSLQGPDLRNEGKKLEQGKVYFLRKQ